MATYLVLGHYTDQGIRNVDKTIERVDAFKGMARKMGVRVQQVLWTMGPFDMCLLVDAPDDQVASALTLKVGMLGNVKTQTVRAFDAKDMAGVLGKLGG